MLRKNIQVSRRTIRVGVELPTILSCSCSRKLWLKKILIASINNPKQSKCLAIKKEKKNRLIEHEIPKNFYSFLMYVHKKKTLLSPPYFILAMLLPMFLHNISHTSKYPWFNFREAINSFGLYKNYSQREVKLLR